MGNSSRKVENKTLGVLSTQSHTARIAIFFVPLILIRGVWAEDLRVQPSILLSEQYSDNIYLTPSGANTNTPGMRPRVSSFISMISPGFYATRRSGPWSLNLYYRLQGIFYTGSAAATNFNNQLGMMSTGEIIDNSLYLNLTANIGQYNNAGAFGQGVYAIDNVSRTGNTNTYQTFRINPYWTPHLGGYVSGVVGLNYSYTTAGSGGLSNGNQVGEYVNLYNGKEFSTLGWRASFFQQDMFGNGQGNNGAGSSGDVTYRNYSGQMQYRLWEHVQPFVQAGVYENSFGAGNSVKGANNGSYWNIGLIWTPSRKTYFQAGAGSKNYFATLRWSPSKRTDFYLSFRDSDVGGTYGGYGGYGGLGGYGGGVGFGGYGGGYGGLGGYSGGAGTTATGTGPIGGIGSGGAVSAGGACGSGGFGSMGMGGGMSGYGMGGYGDSGIGGIGLGGGFGGGGIGFGGLGGAGAGFGSLGGGFGGSGIGVGGLGSGLNSYGGFNSGSTWNGSVCHRTRRTIWQAMYTEYTTTAAQIFQDTQQAYIPSSQPTNVNSINEIITRKRAQTNVTVQFPKSNFSLTGFQENANYQSTGDQSVLGMAAFWNWRFATRTSSQLMFSWQSFDNKPASSPQYSSDFSMVSLGIYHTLSKHVSGGLSYRHVDQSSDLPTASYTENRIMANVFIRY